MPDPQRSEDTVEEITFHDISPTLEFICWIVVFLAPILRWINGAAVTTDQYIIQMSLVSIALSGAVGLRIYHWVSGLKASSKTLVEEVNRQDDSE